jgi:glycosyltransferase involved in cell wall biosynthesis
MAILAAQRRPAWFKYAGNWRPDTGGNPTYALQRWWLGQSWHRGLVTINGAWPGQPDWIRTFFNPSLDDPTIDRGRQIASTKQLGTPISLAFVGGISERKGAGRALEILRRLRARNIDATLVLAGDGPERERFETQARNLRLTEVVRFLGWQSSAGLHDVYAKAHVLLLPTATEGWPKVLSEGMAFGAVPVASAVGSIPHHLHELGIGHALPVVDVEGFADAIEGYVREPARWRTESQRAVAATERFTYRHYLTSVDELVAELAQS